MLEEPAPEPMLLPVLEIDNPEPNTPYDAMYDPHMRLECLKIAVQIALETRHFDRDYKDGELFFQHLEQLYEIADHNIDFIRLTGES